MSHLRRSITNMFSGTIGWIAPTLVNLAATPLLLNKLGHTGYGLQNLVGVVTGYVMLMDMGLDIPVTKFLAEDRGRKDERSSGELAIASLQFYAGLGLLGAIVIFLSAGLLSSRVFTIPLELQKECKLVFQITALAFFVNVISIWGRAIACGFQRYDVANATSAAGSIGGVALGLIAVASGYGVVGFVAMKAVSSAIAAGFYIVTVRRWGISLQPRWEASRKVFSRIHAYLASGIILRISGIIVSSLDRTLIAAWLSVSALTTYAIPSLIAVSFTQLVGSTIHFTLPMASEFHGAGQKDLLRELFTKASRFVAFLSTGCAVILLVLGDKLLAIWVGTAISESAKTVIIVLIVAAYLQTMTVQLANNAAVAMGHIREFTVYSVIRSSVIVIGCIALIRPFGLEGAAFAILSAEIVDIVYMMRVVRGYLQMSFAALFMKAYSKPLYLGIIIAAFAVVCRPAINSWFSFGVLSTSLAALYVICATRIGVLEHSEKRALWDLVKSAF